MNIERALTIPGWMAEPELLWLSEQASTHSCILEVGSFLGRSTRALADSASGVVFAVDLWTGSPEILKQYSKLGGPAGVFNLFQTHVSDLLGTKLFPIMLPSVSASQVFPLPIFDMIFLDGAHDFYSVLADIACWGKLLKAGGLLCGHDYTFQNFPGLVAAVDSLVPNRHIVPETSIWYATLEKQIIPPVVETEL